MIRGLIEIFYQAYLKNDGAFFKILCKQLKSYQQMEAYGLII